MGMRVARAYDEGQSDPAAALFARISVAIAKYWTNKRAAYFINEAMECLGGAGYVEESMLPRLYREAPLNGIWEGSGNVICLDVLRAIARTPATLDVFLNEVQQTKGESVQLDQEIQKLQQGFANREFGQYEARYFTEKMAICLQASLLIRYGHPAVRDAFLSSRFGGKWGRAYGTLSRQVDTKTILARSWPALA